MATKVNAPCIKPPFNVLLKVLRVTSKESKGVEVYTVLLDGGLRIAGTAKHLFFVLRRDKWEFSTTGQLQTGDQMWVNASMLLGDGALNMSKKVGGNTP